MTLQHKSGIAFLLLLFAAYLVGCGRHPRSPWESDYVELKFASFHESGLGPPIGTIVLHNRSQQEWHIVSVAVYRENEPREVVSDLLRLSNCTLCPNAWEFAKIQVSDLAGIAYVEVEYESRGESYTCSRRIESSDIACTLICSCCESATLLMYARVSRRFLAEPCCYVNGVKAIATSMSQIALNDGSLVVALTIEPRQELKFGDRVFVEFSPGEGICYGGVTKVFRPFVAGITQYELGVRAVQVDHRESSITLGLYNESDYHKSPAIIERVYLDGKDVSEMSVFPRGAIPPDMHFYERDSRRLLVPYESPDITASVRFDIRYRLVASLSQEARAREHTSPQTLSFATRRGFCLPLGPENGFGLENGACIHYGGLRPLPSLSDIVRRSSDASKAEPAIPLYACIPEGTRQHNTIQIAACCDFIMVGQSSPFSTSTLHRGCVFPESFTNMDDLGIPWAASLHINADTNTCAKDIEWIAWNTIASGGRGVSLGLKDSSDAGALALCKPAIRSVLAEIRRLAPFLDKAFRLPELLDCNQQGIRASCLLCGTDQLIVIATNEWNSRATFQCEQPCLAAIRHGVEIRVPSGDDWIVGSATHLCTQESVRITREDDGSASLHLPQFDTVAMVLISRRKKPVGARSGHRVFPTRQLPPNVLFCSSPIVSLGTVRPESTHPVKVRVRCLSNEPQSIMSVEERSSTPLRGSFFVPEVSLSPGEESTVLISYTAPKVDGESVTSIHLDSSSMTQDEPLKVYVCAAVRDPAKLSPPLVDFGRVAIDKKSSTRKVKVRSHVEDFRIGQITGTSMNIAGAFGTFRAGAWGERRSSFGDLRSATPLGTACF